MLEIQSCCLMAEENKDSVENTENAQPQEVETQQEISDTPIEEPTAEAAADPAGPDRAAQAKGQAEQPDARAVG